MKRRVMAFIFTVPLLLGLSVLQSLRAQTCSPDEGMVKSYVQSITSLVGTVRKESLSDFQKDYHEQTCLSQLALSLGIVNSLIDCLNRAAKDPADTPQQMAAIKVKLQKYDKLKSTLEQERNTLKAAKSTKSAKSIIGKFTISS